MDYDNNEVLDSINPSIQNKDGEKYLCEYLILFRQAIREMDGLVCPNDDIFLLRFLRTKKFNVEESVKLLHLYFDMKRIMADLTTICFSTLRPIYDTKIIMAMQQRDSAGRKMLFIRFGKWNPLEAHYEHVVVAAFFLLEEMTRSEETQKNGVVIIVDSAQLTFNQTRQIVMQLTFSKLRRLAYCLKGTYPALFKAIHVINYPKVVDIVFATFKLFLSEKLRKRVHLHGHDNKSLHKFVNPEFLPMSLGGSKSMEEIEDKILLQSMLNKEDYYKRLQHYYGYQESS